MIFADELLKFVFKAYEDSDGIYHGAESESSAPRAKKVNDTPSSAEDEDTLDEEFE